jgi:hypothetical protein
MYRPTCTCVLIFVSYHRLINMHLQVIVANVAFAKGALG